jgi:hypothetical protein
VVRYTVSLTPFTGPVDRVIRIDRVNYPAANTKSQRFIILEAAFTCRNRL